MLKRYLTVFLLSISAITSYSQWTALNGPSGANVQDLERNSTGKLFMITNQKLFQSINGGDSWSAIAVESPSNLTLDDIIIDSNNKMYGVNNSDVFTSTDGGLNWTAAGTNGKFFGMSNIVKFGPDGMLAIYGQNGMYVSSDDGANWLKIHNTSINHVVASSSGTLFAAVSNQGIKRYIYPGLSGPWDISVWTLVNELPIEWRHELYYDDDTNVIYASLYNTNDIIRSTDDGERWSSIKTGITESFLLGRWAKSPDGKIFLASRESGNIYYTPNTGTACDGGFPCVTWTTISNVPANTYGSTISELIFESANTLYLALEGDAVFKTNNLLTAPPTWVQKATGLNFGNGTEVEIANAGGRILYLNNTKSKGYWTSTTGGSTWSFVSLPDNISTILKLTDGTLMMYGDACVYRSTDNTGNLFTKVSTDGFKRIVQSPGNGNLYAIKSNTQIATSTDKGTTWTYSTITTGMPVTTWNFHEHIAVDNSDVVYTTINVVNTGVRFYKVTGTVGTEITNGPWITATDANLSPTNVLVSNGKLYLSEYNSIFESSDGGTTWTTISFSGNYIFPIAGGICVSRAGNPGSLYVTQDGGLSWNSTSLPAGTGSNTYITDLAVDGAGDFIASAYNSPALKFTGDLVVDPGTLPPHINFNWQPTNGPYGGQASEVFKNTINNTFALVMGDVYKTTSFASWENISVASPHYFFDLLYVADNSIYGLTQEGLYSSADGGTTWNSVNSEPSITSRSKMVRLTDGTIAFYSHNRKVYVSNTAGPSYTFGTPKYELLNNEIFLRFVNTSDKIFLCVEINGSDTRKITRFDNNGSNSTVITLPPALTKLVNISAHANTLYIWGDTKELYKSIDNGATWTDITGDLNVQINFVSQVYVSPTSELYIVGNSQLFKSTNNGINWTPIGTIFTNSIYDIIWVGTRMVIATDEGVFTSDDGGTTVTQNNKGITKINVNELHLTGANQLYALRQEKTYSSSDLQNWLIATPQFKGIIDMADGSFLAYTCSDYHKSTDGGQTWTKQGDFQGPSCNVGELVTPDGVSFYNKTAYKIFHTNNLNATWTELNITGVPSEVQNNFESFAADKNGIGYLILFNNQSQTRELYQILFGSAIRLALSTAQPLNVQYHNEKIVIFFANGSIFETSDGSSWASKSAPVGTKLIIANNNYYFIPQLAGGLWLSRNTGQTWQDVGLSMNPQTGIFSSIVVNESNGYAYGSLSNSPVLKSANIVIPDDGAAPTIVSVTPADNATGVDASTNLTIKFSETVIPQAAKVLRIIDATNTSVPLETINVTSGIINGKSITFNPTTTLQYLKSYFIVFDAGAFKDLFGNVHGGNPTSQTFWNFTVQDAPDTQAPIISYTETNFTKGQTNVLSITASDNMGGSGVSPSTVKLFYRGIMSNAAVTDVTIPNTTGNTFQISIPNAWLDELGLEYYFTAADMAGNSVRSPSGTSFHHARLHHSEINQPVIPAGFIGVGGKSADYKMFSIPFDLQSGAVSAIFNELGAADNTQWRIVQYSNSSGSYSDATSISRGTGYWINSKTVPSAISIEGATTPTDTKTTEFQMALKKGWNLIGNPYPFTINWATVKGGNANIGDVKTYNGNFNTDNTLSPFEAGFVLLNGSDVTVTIPFSAKAGGRMHDPNSFDGGWLLPLILEDGELKNDLGGLGMHQEADSSYDQFDDMPLPRLFDVPEIHFRHPEHFMKKFTRDIVPVQEEFEWSFTADVNENNKAVLSWNHDQLGEFNKNLFLLDESTQTLVDMMQQNRYSFLASQSPAFKVYFGKDISKIKPTSIILNKPYPNPTQNGSSVSFTLPENAAGKYNVSLDIYDLLGNKIATLIQEQLGSGFHTKTWAPEQQQISSGLYIYKLVVSDKVNRKILTEKLVIQK